MATVTTKRNGKTEKISKIKICIQTSYQCEIIFKSVDILISFIVYLFLKQCQMRYKLAEISKKFGT